MSWTMGRGFWFQLIHTSIAVSSRTMSGWMRSIGDGQRWLTRMLTRTRRWTMRWTMGLGFWFQLIRTSTGVRSRKVADSRQGSVCRCRSSLRCCYTTLQCRKTWTVLTVVSTDFPVHSTFLVLGSATLLYSVHLMYTVAVVRWP